MSTNKSANVSKSNTSAKKSNAKKSGKSKVVKSLVSPAISEEIQQKISPEVSAPTTVQTIETKIPLCNRSMLVSLSISCYGGNKRDKQLSKEYCAEKAGDSTVMGIQKVLLKCEKLSAIKNWAQNIRNDVQMSSLPWLAKSRILPSENFIEFKLRIEEKIRQLSPLVESFIADYAQLMEIEKSRFGSAFNPNNYPSPNELRNSFSASLKYTRLGFAQNDFRLQGIDPSFEQEILAKERENTEKLLQAGQSEILKRILYGNQPALNEGLGNGLLFSIHRLKLATNDEAGKSFKSSTITKIAELAKMGKSLNSLGGNAQISDLLTEIESLFSSVNPENVREVSSVREKLIEDASAKVESVRNLMASFMGSDEESEA